MALLKSSLRHSEARLMARVAVIVSRRTSRAVTPFLAASLTTRSITTRSRTTVKNVRILFEFYPMFICPPLRRRNNSHLHSPAFFLSRCVRVFIGSYVTRAGDGFHLDGVQLKRIAVYFQRMITHLRSAARISLRS